VIVASLALCWGRAGFGVERSGAPRPASPAIFSAFAALLLLFPTGRLLSPRWRPVAWMMVGWIAGVAVGNFAYPPDSYLGVEAPVRLNQAAGQIMTMIGGLAWLLVTLAVPAAAASLVVRFRRSRGQERQQLKWLAYAAAMLGVGVLGRHEAINRSWVLG
jgi:hypothetical protein